MKLVVVRFLLKLQQKQFLFTVLISEDNFKMATNKGIKLIARMPDNVLIAKSSIEETAGKLNIMQILTLENAKGESVGYRILEKT